MSDFYKIEYEFYNIKMEVYIILIMLFLEKAQAFATLLKITTDLPGDIYKLENMTVGESFSATMFVNSSSYSFRIFIQPVGGSVVSQNLTSPYTFSHTATIAATHYFRIRCSYNKPIDYRLEVTRAGITTNYSNFAVSYNYLKKI